MFEHESFRRCDEVDSGLAVNVLTEWRCLLDLDELDPARPAFPTVAVMNLNALPFLVHVVSFVDPQHR